LTIVSVALGVAVVIAVELAGEAAVGSFRSSLETLLGKTDLQVTANGGVDETWIARLAGLPRHMRLAPVIGMHALIDGGGAVLVCGIDVPAQGTAEGPAKSGLGVSSALARRLGIRASGAPLILQINDSRQQYEVSTVVDAKDAEFAVMDIADAQKAL